VACRGYEGGSLHGKTADFQMRDLSLFVVGVHRRNAEFPTHAGWFLEEHFEAAVVISRPELATEPLC
jgi:hypothetical protein